MKLLRILLLLFAILLTDKLSAQKVGLVLSGGGAKGLAHIGVIKALEENNIPIDCITGTSIGAIVGGLYAIGYSPDEMIELFSSKEFHTWYTGAKEEAFTNYSQKLNPSADVLYLRFDFKKGNFKMQLPTNFVSTYQMDLAFLQLFAAPNAAANEDFNRLFVPFRCVATDINHKRSYIAKNGDLGTAVRASMTFPLYFKPVVLDSLLLFDGGMYNNFPQDIMVREFNPDYIIGSKCAGNSLKADEEDIFLQLENMVMQTTDYDVSHDCGVLIESKFENVSLLEFNRVAEFVDSGYHNTLKLIDSIKQRVPANADREEVNRRREEYKKSIPPLVFKDVNVTGQTNPHRVNYIKTIFSGRKQKPFDFSELKDRYFKMVGSETVSTLYPTASKDSTSSFFDINLRVVPASRFKVSVGGNISSSNAQEGYVGLEYKYWKRALTTATANLYYGRLYSSGMIGARQELPTPHTIFYELYGIYNRYDYYSGSPEIFLATNKPSYLKQNDYQFRTGIGVALDNNTPLKLTMTEGNSIGEYYQTVDFAVNDIPDKSKIDYVNYALTAERNTLNHTQFPTKGRRVYVSARYIGTEETYSPGTTSSLARCDATPSKVWAVRASGEHYYTISKHLSLGYMFDAVYSRKSDFSNYLSTVLMAPAFQPTIHSKTIFIPEFRSNAYLGAGFMPTLFLTEKVFLKSGIYTFMPYQEIIRNPNNSTSYGDPVDRFLWSGCASAVWNSPLGPLSISMNYYDKQDNRFYFVFNFGFILFNRSGIEY